MVRFSVLSGKTAGASLVTRRFPVQIGRAKDCGVRVEADGAWDHHCRLNLNPRHGYVLTSHSDALTTVNGEPQQTAVLRNGDVIGAGSARVQFWLAECRQRGLAWREVLTWVCISLLCVGQIVLVYLLLQV